MNAGARATRAVVSVFALLSGAALLPVAVAASTSSAVVALSPAHGAASTHFTATFTFTATPCDEYSVGFWWDSANPQLLGATYASDYGEGCRASVDATPPQNDATAGATYTVAAYSNPGAVSFGGGPGPRGDAPFTVTADAATPAPPPAAPTPLPASHAGGSTESGTAAPVASPNAVVIERRGNPAQAARPSPPAGEPLIAGTAGGDPAPVGAMVASLVLVAAAMAVRIRVVGPRAWPLRRPRPSPVDSPPRREPDDPAGA